MSHPRPVLGLFAGIAAGLIASVAMAAFQSVAAKPLGLDQSDDDPATVKAADRLALATTGRQVPEDYRPQAGQAVHYLTGAALGGLYGVLTEYRPGAAAGFGSLYGAATSLLLDEAAVPAAGLGSAPWETGAATHAYGAAAHLVFGVALEGARSVLGGRQG
jgi:putative membrane protein